MKPSVQFSEISQRQDELERQAVADDRISIENIKYVAGFDVAYIGSQAIVSAVVMEFQTLKIVEKKTQALPQVMNYVPGLQAFRDGPLICQLYYDLEYEPDVLVVSGPGIAHPKKAGLATFVGVELGKPTVGCAKSVVDGRVEGADVVVEDEVRGRTFRAKEHANDLFVSPGHMLSIGTSVEILKRCVVHPHKLPEMLHVAHRVAKRAADDLRLGKVPEQKEEVIEEIM
ncbi:endonuclease V [Candidatus Woesearchaeota archaeon]|nr:MAG: endonuclease V [Candidatus Woesearchaeota archaeon]